MKNKINQKQYDFLKKGHKRNALSQAYLFVGPEKVGKFDLAIWLIGLVNGVDDFEKISAGQDPDVFLIEPEMEKKGNKIREKDISIEQFKDVSGKLGYFSYQSKFKVLLVRGAQKMTTAASNSLLKLIEEPPKDLLVILVGDNQQQIIPTIKSRCQIVRFGLADTGDVSNRLKEIFPGEDEGFLKECAQLSDGKIKIAEKFVSDRAFFEQSKEVREVLRKVLRGGVLSGLELAEKNASDRGQLLNDMTGWISYLREFLVEQLQAGTDRKILRKVFSMLEELVELRSQIENTNVNQRLQLENFFVKIS